MPSLSLNRRRAVTAGLLLGLALGALEATVVGTAMPTVVAQLGGLSHYSWVFSGYLLSSTASVPIWGRLSDHYGRRRLYMIGVVLFLAGSALAGASQTMTQLILFRFVQGFGAGAIIPISMTILGEIYTLQERARVQALSSGMWGVASIAGPLVGGYITDAISWRWVFYLNLPLGTLAALVIGATYPRDGQHGTARIDWIGAALLFASVSLLLAGLSGVTASRAGWFIGAVILGAAFIVQTRRIADPILPLGLFDDRVIAQSLGIVFLVGMALFGAIAFIPLFVQGVQGGTATDAGTLMTPLFLGWVTTSILGARLFLNIGYRTLSVVGTGLVTLAFAALAQMDAAAPRWLLSAIVFVLGAGMGFTSLTLLLLIQQVVPRAQLGVATSLNQFSRSVGASIGVAVMGAVLAASMPSHVMPVINPGEGSGFSIGAAEAGELTLGLERVFLVGAIMSALAFVGALFLPKVALTASSVGASTGEQLLAAEMTTLEPDDEPDTRER